MASSHQAAGPGRQRLLLAAWCTARSTPDPRAPSRPSIAWLSDQVVASCACTLQSTPKHRYRLSAQFGGRLLRRPGCNTCQKCQTRRVHATAPSLDRTPYPSCLLPHSCSLPPPFFRSERACLVDSRSRTLLPLHTNAFSSYWHWDLTPLKIPQSSSHSFPLPPLSGVDTGSDRTASSSNLPSSVESGSCLQTC
ncbi:hypothetical protein VTN77DRAFT_8003 [Rasamsonia byssochlamydoides]|uniref:uncharacterized protein n=1 Tax=Rasamsonia byssochlamydoides TaxID=89139 RepID=UPI00374444AB